MWVEPKTWSITLFLPFFFFFHTLSVFPLKIDIQSEPSIMSRPFIDQKMKDI